MLQTWRRSSQLFSDFNNFQFAGAMGMVLFVVLLLFMTDSSHYHHRGSVDLPKVIHPVSMFEVTVEDSFAAGHYLRNYKGKCENPHGHNYKIRVTLAGAELDKAGLLLDFKDLREVMKHGDRSRSSRDRPPGALQFEHDGCDQDH